MKWMAKAAAIAGTVVLGGLLGVRSAAAEQITITSGLLEWSADPGSRITFTLGSDQWTSSGSVGQGDFRNNTVKFDGDDDGDDVLKVVMNGTGEAARQIVNGDLMLNFAPLSLPTDTDVTHGMATVSEPFTLTGSLAGLGIGNSASAQQFVGSGVLLAMFNVNNPNVVHLRFEFGPSSSTVGTPGSSSGGGQGAPSPTPEPATLLLLGSGIAGLALVRRRRATRA